MTLTAVIALFVFFVCIAAAGRPTGPVALPTNRRHGRRAQVLAGRRGRG
jgi:hypothetical protein